MNDAPEPQESILASEASEETPSPAEWKAELSKKNREAQNLRRRLKDLEEQVSKTSSVDESKASELEKAVERAAAAEARVAELESESLRLSVAQEKGLTPAQAKRLQGSTKEDLEADADELLAVFAPKGQKADKPSPKSLAGGSDPTQDDRNLGKSAGDVADAVMKKRMGF